MVKQKPDQHYQLKSLNHRFVDNTSALRSMIKAVNETVVPKINSTVVVQVQTTK
ncbi:hypothetical protein [Mucilaginibacter sp. OAE612]|uniref:hypothetical protein n=1 Tax=unclassified Mucilaginibacter TaxID=2617802 RepID=UPI00359ED895